MLEPRYRIPLAGMYASELTVAQRNGILLVASYRVVTAYDAETGTRLWSRNDVRLPTLTDRAIYAGLVTPRADAPLALLAIAPRTGATIWKRPADVAGPIVVDDAGIVAGGARSITAFDFHGKPRWSRPSYGGFSRLLVVGDSILALSDRSGAILHGEFERFDRATGVRRGAPDRFEHGPGHAILYFGPLFDVRGGHAFGANDFGADYETHCTKRDILDVDLATMTSTRMTYVLDQPSQTLSTCVGAREERPTTTIANGVVALGSGTLTAFYRTGSATPMIPIMHDATLVGGPFAGYYYLNRPHGLDALRFVSGGARMLHFANVRAPHVAVAGIADRLYVAADDRIEAYAVGHFQGAPLRRYAARCPVIVAVSRTDANDVLICRENAIVGTSSIIALPLTAVLHARSGATSRTSLQGIRKHSADFAR